MPFKMMGKSPLMKKLVGKQGNLPPALKSKIEAAPESPAKLKKASPAKNNGALSQDFNNAYNYFFGDGKKTVNKDGVSSIQADAAQGVTSGKTDTVLAEKEKLKNKKQKEEKRLFDEQQIENDNFDKDLGFEKNKTKEKTEKIAGVKDDSKSSVSLGDAKDIKGSPVNPSKLSSMIRGNASVQDGKDMAKVLNVEKPLAATIKDKVTDKVQVGSGSTKRLPIDAMQDRLTKNIDRRTRKSDIRKQTRTAKKSLRQEGSPRKEARDKVGKLGINPNTGKSFDNAKQKQDFINNKSDKKKSNTNQTSNPFSKEQQAEIDRTAAAFGFGKNSSTSGSSKKTTGDNFLSNLKSTSKPPKLKGAGKKITEGVSFGTATSKQKSNKKVSSTKVAKKESKPLETKSFNVDKALKSKGKDIKKSNKVIQKELGNSEKERVKEGKKEIKGVRKERKKTTKQFEKSTDKSKKGGLSNLKKNNVPSSVAKVPVAKRPALYDDGYKDESPRSKSTVKREVKKVKEGTSRGKRRSTTLTAESIKAGKPVTVRERLKELRKEKRGSPTKMKTKTPSKMMKKAPSKMMKKAAAPKMMKKAPAKMMKKKKK